MKNLIALASLAILTTLALGCGKDSGTTPSKGKDEDASARKVNIEGGTTTVGLTADLCGQCGCCAGCDDCCEGEKCEKCAMQKGTQLCCSGVAPAEMVYCKLCGLEKGSENCCSDSNEKCEKCGLAEASAICCKVHAASHADDHDHTDGDHDDHDGENHDGDEHN